MLTNIIRFSIKNKLVIGLMVFALIGMGIYDFSRLPIDAVPDITNNQVQVITISPSQAAPEVERLVTFPIEQSVASIPGITEMRSFSRFGLSLVTIVFDDATDVYWARQQVNEKLSQIKDQIPSDAGRPELAPVTTGLGEIFQYAVRPAKGYEGKYSAMELRTIQDWIIRRQLLGTTGVADVSSFGGYLKQYEVAVAPDKLKAMGVSIKEVFTALQLNNQNTGGAYIEKGPNILYIRSEGLTKTTEDIGKTFVKHTTAGIPVYVKDLAEVRIGNAVRYGAMCFNDQGEVAGAVVMMLKGANSSKVIKEVKEKIKVIEKTLPEGVVIEPFLDRTKMVDHAIGTVKQNLLEGALIVIFVLVIFLGNIRAGLVVASVIPLAMMFAIIMMNLFGVSGNLMSLGALDFGLIVDGAVIIVEAVMHRLYHSRHFATTNIISKEQMNEEVEHSAGKMMNSAVFGQIIILIVYLPILSLVGIEGKMFKPMAQTVSFALIGAFILSLTYVPMITSLVLSKNLEHKATWSDRMMAFLENLYQPLLNWALKFPRWLVGSAVTLFVISVFIMSRMGGEFIPDLEEGDFAVDTRVLTGSSLSRTIKATQKSAAILLERFPEVEKVVTKIGSGEIPTDPMPVEASDMMVILKDKKEWTSAKTFDELANKMGKAVEDVPGITVGFQFPVQMRFNELMTGARQDVVCKIFGEDLDSLSAYANRLGEVVSTVKGAKDIYVETVTGLPQIVVHYDRDAMARFQLNVSEVNQVVQTAFAGQSAGMIYENERRFDLVVRLKDENRRDIEDVRNLTINTPSGLQVPLSQVASVEIIEGPNQIQREDAKRRIVVGFNVRGRDVQSIVNELNEKVDTQLKFSPGYYITYGGQFENLVEAKKRLSVAVPVALLLIFIMLYFAFGKLKYGVLIFSAIPLSAIGGIFALWLRGMPFSISAGIGFIALFGVAVLNGIVLIAEFNRLKEQGLHDLKHIVMEGTKVRLRPVLMTAAVASLGFLPMALSNGAGAEVQRPLATVVIGGLITATFLTLLMLPVLYRWFETQKPVKKKSKYGPAAPMILLMLCFASFSNAQTTIEGKKMTLSQCLERVQDNPSLQLLQKEPLYWEKMAAKVFEPAPMQIGLEMGKFNSAQTDNRLFVSQTFGLPIIYNRQKSYYQSQLNAGKVRASLKEQELKKEVRLHFCKMTDLLERHAWLNRLDSVYARWLSSANLRLQTGDAGGLESSSAQLQWEQLKWQKKQIISDLSLVQHQLQWLLKTDEIILPEYSTPKMKISLDLDTAWIAAHPLFQQQLKQQELIRSQNEIEKSKLLPEFSIGYNNLSIRGWQSIDATNQKYYAASDRFQSVNIGMGIPIFNSGIRSKIKAGAYNQLLAQWQQDIVSYQLNGSHKQALIQYKKQEDQVLFYEQFALKQSEAIIKTALLSLEQGNISYMEWTLIMNNALQTQLQYLEAIQSLNQTAIELQFITGK